MSRRTRLAGGCGPPISLLKRGFSLLEILIVVAIIALLLAILVPTFSRARRQTRKTLCKAYQYQLTFADKCSAARMNLEAFDCGCYGEAGKDLYAFRLPADLTEDQFRDQLESDVLQACVAKSKPAS